MRLVLSLALVLASAVPAIARQSCTERLVFVRKILDQDLAMDRISKDVYAKMSDDLAKAEKICKAGFDAQAHVLISATESRHGYPQN